MTVERIPGNSRLQLRLQTGVDNDGKPVFVLKSYSNLKAAATDEDVFEVGQTIGQLQQHVVNEIYRHDSAAIVTTII